MGFVTQLMVRRNNDVAPRYHEFVIGWFPGILPARRATGSGAGTLLDLVLDGAGQAVSLHLGRHLRHIVPKYDDIVLLAADVADVVAQQGLRLEAEAFEQGDGGLLVDRHLDRELFEAS